MYSCVYKKYKKLIEEILFLTQNLCGKYLTVYELRENLQKVKAAINTKNKKSMEETL